MRNKFKNGVISIKIKGEVFKFTRGSCQTCPLGEDACKELKDPRDPRNVHMDFMDFCQTLELENIQPHEETISKVRSL